MEKLLESKVLLSSNIISIQILYYFENSNCRINLLFSARGLKLGHLGGFPMGVLVPLFPSKIVLCSHVPTLFLYLFPSNLYSFPCSLKLGLCSLVPLNILPMFPCSPTPGRPSFRYFRCAFFISGIPQVIAHNIKHFLGKMWSPDPSCKQKCDLRTACKANIIKN